MLDIGQRLGAVANLILKVKGGVALRDHAIDNLYGALTELIIRLSLGLRPADLGYGYGAWPQHVLVVVILDDKLSPQVCLHAEDVACHALGHGCGCGVVGVDSGCE